MTPSPSREPADRPATTVPPAVSRARLRRALVIVVPVAALAYALLFSAPGLEDVGAAVRTLRPRFVALALIGEVVHVLAMAQAYRASLAALGVHLPYRRQLAAFLAGYGVGQLLPAGGAVGGAVVGQRMIAFGAPRAAAAAAVALTGPLSLLAIALLVVVGLVVASMAGANPPGVLAAALGAAVVMIVVVAVVVAVVRSPERGHRILDRLTPPMGRIGADLEAWRASLDQLAAAPPRLPDLARVLVWAMLAWVGNAAVLWLVIAGLGLRLDADVLLVGFGVQHVVAMIPVSPGGIGLVETGMAGTLTALGVAGSTAVTGVIGYRLVSFWLPVAIGLVAYYRSLTGAGRRGL